MEIDENFSIEDFASTCRTCFSQYDADNLSPIDEVHILSGEIKLMDVLLKYTTIENNPNHPQNICSQCVMKAEEAYCFLERCNEATSAASQILEKTRKKIKTERRQEEAEAIIKEVEQSKFEVITIKNDDREDVEIKIIFDTVDTVDEGHRYTIMNAKNSSISEFPIEKCRYCLMEMDAAEFDAHITNFGHHADSDLFLCPHCDVGLKNTTNFKKHLRTHSTRELKKHVCDTCGKVFNWTKNYLKHMASHVSDQERVICPDCGLLLDNMTSLQIHRVKEHVQAAEMEDEWKCQYCHRVFDQIADYKKHVKDVHAEKDFHCVICAKDCGDKRTLYYHEQLHLDEFGIECDYCHKKLLTEEKLVLHQRIHKYVTKKHVCHICTKGFKQLDKLEAHIRVHTGEKPFICKYCSKAFNHENNLTHHVRLHTGDTPYKCLFCSQEFSNSHSLRKHMNTHDMGKNEEYVSS